MHNKDNALIIKKKSRISPLITTIKTYITNAKICTMVGVKLRREW